MLIQFYSVIQCNTYWYIASFFKVCVVHPHKASFYPQTRRFRYNFRFESCPLVAGAGFEPTTSPGSPKFPGNHSPPGNSRGNLQSQTGKTRDNISLVPTSNSPIPQNLRSDHKKKISTTTPVETYFLITRSKRKSFYTILRSFFVLNFDLLIIRFSYLSSMLPQQTTHSIARIICQWCNCFRGYPCKE